MSSLHLALTLQHPEFALAVDLTLPARGITALFGHSGSGKTTLLRALAGLERTARGHVRLGDTVWQDDAQGVFVPPHQRAIGYVFQEASLFDHLSVSDNLNFGLKRTPPAQRQFQLTEVADWLGIHHLLSRSTAGLSGGERQRIAIARALLTSPALLLMDEPLAALDLKRKQEILPYLERLHRELVIPMIYVSHAPDEVARLADYLVVLEQGQVRTEGPLLSTLARTDLPPIFADDAGVVIEAMLIAHEEDDLSCLVFDGQEIRVPRRPESVGSRLRCRIHARDISLAITPPQGSSILNIFSGQVAETCASSTPGQVLVKVMVGDTPLLARITERSRRELGLQPGTPVWAQVKAVALL